MDFYIKLIDTAFLVWKMPELRTTNQIKYFNCHFTISITDIED